MRLAIPHGLNLNRPCEGGTTLDDITAPARRDILRRLGPAIDLSSDASAECFLWHCHETLRPFLSAADGEGGRGFALYHSSLREFLTGVQPGDDRPDQDWKWWDTCGTWLGTWWRGPGGGSAPVAVRGRSGLAGASGVVRRARSRGHHRGFPVRRRGRTWPLTTSRGSAISWSATGTPTTTPRRLSAGCSTGDLQPLMADYM